MKKLLTAFLLLTIVISIWACDSPDTPVADDTLPADTPPEVPESEIVESEATEPIFVEPQYNTTSGFIDPIGEYDREQTISVEEGSTDSFLIKDKKLNYQGRNVLVIYVENLSDKAYSIELTVKLINSSGKTESRYKKEFDGFAGGWQNFFFITTGTNYKDCEFTLKCEEYDGETYSGYISTGGNPVWLNMKSNNGFKTDIYSASTSVTDTETVTLVANFPTINVSDVTLSYTAEYILLSEDGNILSVDTSHIKSTIDPIAEFAKPYNSVESRQVGTSNVLWENKNEYSVPEDYLGEIKCLISYSSIDNALKAADEIKAERAEFNVKDIPTHWFTSSNGYYMPYRIYLPNDYSTNKKYPVLLFLHGGGSRGRDGNGHIRELESFFAHPESPVHDCILVAPQCHDSWVQGTTDAVAELLDYINYAYSTDPWRQYVTGGSLGGHGTWDLLMRHPEKVSAALPVASVLGPTQAQTLCNVVMTYYTVEGGSQFLYLPKEVLQIPIRCICDTIDYDYAPAYAADWLYQAFTNAGGTNMHVITTEGLGHSIARMYVSKNDISNLEWLFSQVRDPASCAVTDELDEKTFNEGKFKATNTVTLPYRLYVPDDYTEGKEYPVVLFLHPYIGYTQTDNRSQLGLAEQFFKNPDSPVYDSIVIIPQMAQDYTWEGNNADAAMELLAYVNSAYSTDKTRQYIIGSWQGGDGVFDILTRYPTKISAVLVANTSALSFSEDYVLPDSLLETPIHFIYGYMGTADDPHLADTYKFSVIEKFEEANAKNFTYAAADFGMGYMTQYVTENDISLLEWLFDQRRETEQSE